LTRSGLRTEYDPFTFGSGGPYSSRNIVATLPGKTSPERVVIVCAHYDSISNQPATLAPGADDNGSGTAAVQEIARVLAGHAFDDTLEFICFSAEEWGLYGSDHYAQAAKARGEKIVGVLNLDMIGIPDPYADRLDLVVNTGSRWLFDRYTQAASTYAGMRTHEVLDNSWDYSDQSPFWDNGYSALCGIENEDPSSPYNHQTTDVLATLNMDFVASITRATLAAAADLAQPVSTPLTPSGLLARSQITSSLYAAVKTVVLRWNANSDPVAGYNVYRAQVSGGPYEKITASPASATEFRDRLLNPALRYFYVLTAVDAQGRESRASAEAADSPQAWVN
jgi:Zn-dependent M28 family amino/carboxypeptidase